MKYLLLTLLCSTILWGCQNTTPTKEATAQKVQEDINALGQLINLQIQPIRVNFVSRKAVEAANSRLAVGPSDYVLEAILYYNSEDFKTIQEKSKFWASSSPFSKEQYQFAWLNDTQKKIIQAASATHCTPSFFAKQSLRHGGFLVLEDTQAIALLLMTN